MKIYCKDCKWVGFHWGVPVCKNPETLIGKGRVLSAYGEMIKGYHVGNNCRYHNSKNDCKLFEPRPPRKGLLARLFG